MVLPHLTVSTVNPHAHNSTCFILHGLGDSGHGWSEVAQILSSTLPATKFILPHAPKRRVTLNGGYSMPAWYDIYGLSDDAPQDQAGILESVAQLQELIAEEEKRGIPRERIVIGGFSQGGAVALTTGLCKSSPEQANLAGILALSTYLPIKPHFDSLKSSSKLLLATDTPIFMCHGTADQVISHKWAERSYIYLKQDLSCSRIEFESIPRLEHSINQKAIELVSSFLRKVLKYN